MNPVTPPIQPRQIAVGELRFDAWVCGDEQAPAVLLLHGFPEFADAWQALMPRIAAAGFRAIAFDQRGYSPGARPTARSAYAIDTLCGDVLAVADALGIERFHLVGHDWGGLLAWRLAARRPERLISLAVLSTPHIDAFRAALKTDPDQRRRSRYIVLFRLPFGIPERLLLGRDAARLRRAYGDSLPAARIDANLRRLRAPGTLRAALNWYRALDLRGRAGRITVPTLYLWGDRDMALGPVAAQATAQHVDADYRFVVLRGASHWLPEEAPDAVSAPLLAHLQRWQTQAPPPPAPG